MKLHLAARPPFSFRAVADSHGWRQLAPFSGDGDGLSYIARLSAGRVIELRLAEAPDGAQIECAGALTDAEQTEIVALAGWMLGLVVHAADFNVLDTRFKTGEIYQDADYDAQRWDAVFAKYPKLKGVFNTRRKAEPEKDSSDEPDND